MEESVLLSQDHGPVRLLTLNRPHRLNALNEDLKDASVAALAGAERDDSVAVVVFTGAGRAFSAGADLERFAAMYKQGDHQGRVRFTDLAFPRAFQHFSKPLIAAINGAAVGWGFTMPLMCDLRLASSQAMFSAAFVKVGVTPEFGSAYWLPRIVGLGRAMDLVLTARQFDAAEAYAMGLVNQVVPADDLLPRALELAAQIAALPRPAVLMAKSILRLGAQASLDQTITNEVTLFQQAMATPEHYEAVRLMQETLARK